MSPIEYPLIDLGDGFPPSRSSIELYHSTEELGLCNRLAIMRGAFSEERRFYDRHGKIYKFGRVTPEPQVSGFQRFLAHICYNPVTKFDVELKALGEAGLEDLKIRIRDLLANDPGDLLYQWADAQEWEAGLNETDSIPELFDFITKRALAEHCHQNTAEGEDAADGEALPGSCDPH